MPVDTRTHEVMGIREQYWLYLKINLHILRAIAHPFSTFTHSKYRTVKKIIPTLVTTSTLLISSMSLSHCAGGLITDINADSVDPAALANESRRSLQSLYQTNPSAKALGPNAKGILVFPKIAKGGFIVGAMGGNGSLVRPDGKVQDFYETGGLSYGYQAGVQEYGYALFLMDDDAIRALNASNGWAVGSSPSLVVMNNSLSSSLSTTTMNKGTFAFFFNEQGLMGGAGLEGSKITRIHPNP